MAKSSSKKDVHVHGCKRCRRRYEDCCSTPSKNGTCLPCVSGMAPPRWVLNRDPKDCCRVESRPVRKEEIAPYNLAGDDPWWICRVCQRTFVYDPGEGHE